MGLVPSKFGLACGIVWALGLLLLVIFQALFGIGGQWIALMGDLYVGYEVSVVGAILGIIWGFIDGLIGGAVFAWVYNKL